MSALRPMEFLRIAPASAVAAVQVSVAPTTGSASVQIPIPLTPGRDGFGPSLALALGGHDPLSPFAHGWSLAGLPSIDVDVRDGLPAYDGQERFRYAGQELVPLDVASTQRQWGRGEYSVRAFRARVESVPIRAEQWTHASGRIHWRVRTGDGGVQVFGLRSDNESRIADPSRDERTFRWLLESAFDRLGNAMVVRYAAEDDAGIDALGLDGARFLGATANRYPKRVLYGNAAPLAEGGDVDAATWYFEAVFDYGDHDPTAPMPAPSAPWAARQDPSFTGRLGFELRTRRLCRRVLMFHHFPAELGEPSTLVGSLELDHTESPDATTLSRVRYVGWRAESGARVSQPTPWAEIAYTSDAPAESFEVVTVPLLGPGTQMLDVLGEGLPGLFTPTAGANYFARNLGDGAFGAHELLPEWPTGLERAALADFDRDGNLELVELAGPSAGYYRLDRRTRRWEPLQHFGAALSTRIGEGPVLQADMSGDGRPDVVVLHESGLTWLPNLGTRGFGEPVEVRLPAERLPVAQPALDRFLADMTGDGLPDVVEVLNGSVRYWPNLGRGRFGEPVVMDDAPRLDAEGSYDAARVLLVDLDQTGASDLVYLRGDGVVIRAENRRGASFGPLEAVAWGASIPNGARTTIADFNGDGSSCLVIFEPAGSGAAAARVLRLTSSPGARQLAAVTHPLGAVSEVEWGHSVRHYLRDFESGRGWDSPLPSPRPVVDALHRTEPIDGVGQSERFVYHDGHYDPRERGFAVFAVSDHYDVDVDDAPTDVVPLMTRRFSHTGEVDHLLRFALRVYSGDPGADPPPESYLEDPPPLDRDLDAAYGALVGAVVREELFRAAANGAPAAHPIRVVDTSRSVATSRVSDARYRTAVQVVGRETRASEYEETPADPRVSIQRVLDVDAYLTPLLSLQAGLPRRVGLGTPRFAAQDRIRASAASATVTHFDTETRFELAIPVQARSYEVHVPAASDVFDADLAGSLTTALSAASAYHMPLDPEGEDLAARAITHTRVFYWDDARTAALALGQVGAVTLPHHSDEAAYDRGQLTAVFGSLVDPDVDLPPLGYAVTSDVFYRVGPTTRFGGATTFFRLEESEAYDGGIQQVGSDAYHLVAASMTDPVNNAVSAEIDYHVLAPLRLTDPNGTVQEIDYDPLGVARRTSRYGTAMDASSSIVDHGFDALTLGQVRPSLATALADPESALGGAESLLLYEFPAGGAPMRTLSLAAEEFVDRGPDATSTPSRAGVSLTYFDGFGRELQTRMLVEPGVAWTESGGVLMEDEATTRWRVSGYVALDSKGQPRQQHEPFFRDEDAFEVAFDRRRFGVATSVTYDAVGRQVRQDFPNLTFTETTYAAWARTSLDPNDTSDHATGYSTPRQSLPASDPERIASDQALANAGTPLSVHLDPLGRDIATVERIEVSEDLVEEARLDVRGLSEVTIDRRGLTASTRSFDRLGRLLRESSMDAGVHRGLFDAEGREVKHWHEDTEEARVFDLAGRLTERHVVHGLASWLAERITYGEGATGAADRNQLGRAILVEDGAGTLATPRYGAFGEPLATVRTLTATAGTEPDWSGSVALESSGYETRTAFDAVGRPARAFLPDGTERRHEYLRSGPTSRLQILTPDTTVRTILASATYNARGQQTAIELGNGVDVTSTYDAETFRLYRRLAVLGTDTYQDLRHHYDPVGNLVYTDDLAQRPTATHVVSGLTVTAERVFTYDARYQLTEATGRVHNALTRADFRGDAPTSGSFRGTRRVDLNDGGAVTRYRRTYSYDAAGNLEGWRHTGAGGNAWNHDKWISATSNRSYLADDLDGDPVTDPESRFDARGQITSLPNVREMEWSPRSQLRRVVLIERTGDPDDDELYDYASDSKRLRKTTRRLVGGNVETTETIYLEGCELRRVTVSSTTILERWSSHVEDGDARYATLYRWTTDANGRETADTGVVRTHYHLGANLGSVALELGAAGEVLSYEEYFPYGGTAFLAGDAVVDIAFRTLRYVGKDQDDATGFYVFQFRYYAPYLGNWISPDPAGEIDGPNQYWYARNNPASLVDQDGLQTSDDEPAVRRDGGGTMQGPSAPLRESRPRLEDLFRRTPVESAPDAPGNAPNARAEIAPEGARHATVAPRTVRPRRDPERTSSSNAESAADVAAEGPETTTEPQSSTRDAEQRPGPATTDASTPADSSTVPRTRAELAELRDADIDASVGDEPFVALHAPPRQRVQHSTHQPAGERLGGRTATMSLPRAELRPQHRDRSPYEIGMQAAETSERITGVVEGQLHGLVEIGLFARFPGPMAIFEIVQIPGDVSVRRPPRHLGRLEAAREEGRAIGRAEIALPSLPFMFMPRHGQPVLGRLDAAERAAGDAVELGIVEGTIAETRAIGSTTAETVAERAADVARSVGGRSRRSAAAVRDGRVAARRRGHGDRRRAGGRPARRREGLTWPSRGPNPLAQPAGRRTRIPSAADEEVARSLRLENEAADQLAQAGYHVEQNPTVPGPRNPDLRVEGSIFDVYSPEYGTSVRNIFNAIRDKVLSGQTARVVLNLDESSVSIPRLIQELTQRRGEARGLAEVLVVRNGRVHRIYP